jgi:hypothetical protein
VAEEFFEWAFSTSEERQRKEAERCEKQEAIVREVEKIERTLCFIDPSKPYS